MTRPTSPASFDSPELDRQLSAYFKSALPQSWPSLALPSVEPARPRRSTAANSSRVTLAASVALLLGLGVYLTSQAPLQGPQATTPNHGVDLKDPQANGKQLLPRDEFDSKPIPKP